MGSRARSTGHKIDFRASGRASIALAADQARESWNTVAFASPDRISGNGVALGSANLSGSGTGVNHVGASYDLTAPTVKSTAPWDNATGVPPTTNLVVTFNEPVKAGTGNIYLYSSTHKTTRTISISDTSQVSFSGNSMTIDPRDPLAVGTSYDVTFGSGVVTDAAGNKFAGLTSGKLNFTTSIPVDVDAPRLATTAPADDSSGVPITTNLVVTFNEPVKAGTGNIYLYSSTHNTIRTISVSDTSQVSFSGSTMTVNPRDDLAAGTNYDVTFGSGVVTDVAENKFAGLYSRSFNFTTSIPVDVDAPRLATTAPADNSSGVPITTNLVVTFNEPVKAGTGNIYLYSSTHNATRTISVSSSEVSFSGTTMTIVPKEPLAAGTNYELTFGLGVVTDAAGNKFAGVSSGAMNFTTTIPVDVDAPRLATIAPADNSSGVPITTNLVVTFNEPVKAGTGNIYLYSSTHNATRTISVSSSEVSFSGNTMTIVPKEPLAAGTNYEVTFGLGVVTDSAGNKFAGVSSGAMNFTTTTPVDVDAPRLATIAPADNSSGVPITTNLVVTFNEPVKAGTGNIYLYSSTHNATRTISVSSSEVSFSGNTMTIVPKEPLAAGTNYEVTFGLGVVTDSAGNEFAGLSSGAMNFTTTIPVDLRPPELDSTAPLNSAAGVPLATKLVLHFNEPVKAGTGEIYVHSTTHNATRTIAVTSSEVLFSGSTMTIVPKEPLAAGTNYEVTFGPGVVTDAAENPFKGLSVGDLTFTTSYNTSPFLPSIGFHLGVRATEDGNFNHAYLAYVPDPASTDTIRTLGGYPSHYNNYFSAQTDYITFSVGDGTGGEEGELDYDAFLSSTNSVPLSIGTERSIEQVWLQALEIAQQIQDLEEDYWIGGPNSNTFAHKILTCLGLSATEPLSNAWGSIKPTAWDDNDLDNLALQFNGLGGNDVFHSGAGNDTFHGQAGNDWFFSGGGNDTASGGAGSDFVSTGNNGTTITLDSVESVTGGAGYDRLNLMENASVSVSAIDFVIGGTGADRIDIMDAASSSMTVSSIETLIGSSSGKDFIRIGSAGSTMILAAIETLIGSAASDNILFGARSVSITLVAIETITGNMGADWINFGKNGNTSVISLVETLIGGSGYDEVSLVGSGNSIILIGIESLSGSGATDVVTLGKLGNTTTVSNIDVIYGGVSADIIVAVGGSVWLQGGQGADQLTLPSGRSDTICFATTSDGSGFGSNVNYDLIAGFSSEDTVAITGTLRSTIDSNRDGLISDDLHSVGEISSLTSGPIYVLFDRTYYSFCSALGRVTPGSSSLAIANDGNSSGLYYYSDRGDGTITSDEVCLLCVFENSIVQTAQIRLA
ncbi:MAG: Ig-like domain-containing protein [Alphaproteobacteria bacterium]|nr:Ig-like domain-containing protein [Alphaproteobacteria bacterium]